MQLISKNKRSIFLLFVLLIILVTSLSNPIIILISNDFGLHLSSLILYSAFFLSFIKYIRNGVGFHNATLLKFIMLFSISFILSLYFFFEEFSYRNLSGLLSYFYFLIFIFVFSFEKISYERANVFFRVALIITILSMYLIEVATIAGLRSSTNQSGLFYIFPFQLFYYCFFSKQQLLGKVFLIISILASLYAFSFNFQKSAFIFIFASLTLTIWVTNRKARLSQKIIMMILISIPVLLGYDFIWQLFSREIFELDYSLIDTDSTDINALNSSLYRFYAYEYAFNSLTSDLFHFLFGYGAGHFSIVHNGATPHSSALYLLISFGFFGFFSYYFLVLLSLRRVFNAISSDINSRFNGFLIVFILSGLIYSLLNNSNGLAWEETSFATNILFFMAILIPFSVFEEKYE